MAVRYTARLSGVDSICVMLLDVLSGLDELKICTAYELDGERIEPLPQPRRRPAPREAGVRDAARLAEDITGVRKLDGPAGQRRGSTSTASASWSACRSRWSRSARTASRRSRVAND